MTTAQAASYLALFSYHPGTGELTKEIDCFSYAMGLNTVKKGDPDTMKMKEAPQSKYWEQFKETMIKEVRDLNAFGCWTGVLQLCLPASVNILKTTWAFRIKRLLDRIILKFKARFCTRGDL